MYQYVLKCQVVLFFKAEVLYDVVGHKSNGNLELVNSTRSAGTSGAGQAIGMGMSVRGLQQLCLWTPLCSGGWWVNEYPL